MVVGTCTVYCRGVRVRLSLSMFREVLIYRVSHAGMYSTRTYIGMYTVKIVIHPFLNQIYLLDFSPNS